MKKIFESAGNLYFHRDFEGKPASDAMQAHPLRMYAVVSYELKPYPQSPLTVDLYGHRLMGWGFGRMQYRLELDNGITLTGKALGGGFRPNDPDKSNRISMFDIQEAAIVLGADNCPIPRENGRLRCKVDRYVFGVVSSQPLGTGACRNGLARPGFPFSFTADKSRLKLWSTHALRLQFENLEFTLAGSSTYWQALVDRRWLQHDSIVGIRDKNGEVMDWKQIEKGTALLCGLLGWMNHCESPVFHAKGYYRGKLVYKGYNLRAQPTRRRDSFSWLPLSNPEEGGGSRNHTEEIEGLLSKFSGEWTQNENDERAFHLALGMLQSHARSSPRYGAAALYLQLAFVACGIFLRILKRKHARNRRNTIKDCLDEIGESDQLPLQEWKKHMEEQHPDLWGSSQGKVRTSEIGKMSLAIANLVTSQVHVYEALHEQRLLGLTEDVQHYMMEVMMWLTDLMALKVVGYQGSYYNRLTGKTLLVPWAQAALTS